MLSVPPNATAPFQPALYQLDLVTDYWFLLVFHAGYFLDSMRSPA